MNEFLTELAKSGPWAVMAGFLLWTVIKAWTVDRAQVTQLLGEFRGTLDGLKTAVDHLAERLNHGDGK